MPPLGLRKPLSEATRSALADAPVKPNAAARKAVQKAKLDLLSKKNTKTEVIRRDLKMLERKWNGESMATIGADHGLSRERVRQIVDGLEAQLRALEAQQDA